MHNYAKFLMFGLIDVVVDIYRMAILSYKFVWRSMYLR